MTEVARVTVKKVMGTTLKEAAIKNMTSGVSVLQEAVQINIIVLTELLLDTPDRYKEWVSYNLNCSDWWIILLLNVVKEEVMSCILR